MAKLTHAGGRLKPVYHCIYCGKPLRTREGKLRGSHKACLEKAKRQMQKVVRKVRR